MGIRSFLKKSFGSFLSPGNQSVLSHQSQSSITATEMLLRPFTDAGRFGWVNVRPYMAWQYYKQISVIRDAIDLGSDAFVTVPFAIKDKNKNGELITEYDQNIPATEILNLLANPNLDTTECDFKEAQYKTFNVTGDTFMLTTSTKVDSEPLEIYWINSKNVSSTSDTEDIAVEYSITAGMFKGSYRRKPIEDDGGDRIVYVMKDKSTGFYRQLWIIKEFSPDAGCNSGGRGLSKLSSVFMEIESHNGISVHNNSMLKNGVRPSMALIPARDEDGRSALDDPKVRAIKEAAHSFYGGAGNAGNVMVLDAIEKVIELSKSNKDMEFMTLMEIVKSQVYRNLRIPQPLVNDKAMTYANFKEALGMLFKLNTIPFARKYADQINRFLMPRFDKSGRYEYVVNEDWIKALEIEKIIKIKEFKDVYTINELREFIQKEPLDGEQGDRLFSDRASLNVNKAAESAEKQEFITQLMDMGYDRLEAEAKAAERYHECH